MRKFVWPWALCLCFYAADAVAQPLSVRIATPCWFTVFAHRDTLLQHLTDLERPLSVKNTSVLRGAMSMNTNKLCQPQAVQKPQNGLFQIDATGQFYYRPFIFFSGIDTAILACTHQSMDTILIEVKPTNKAPKARGAWLNALNTAHIEADLRPLVADADGNLDPQSFKIIESPLWGSAFLLPSGQLSYEAPQGFSGIERISYRVCDNGLPVFCRSAQLMVYVDNPHKP